MLLNTVRPDTMSIPGNRYRTILWELFEAQYELTLTEEVETVTAPKQAPTPETGETSSEEVPLACITS